MKKSISITIIITLMLALILAGCADKNDEEVGIDEESLSPDNTPTEKIGLKLNEYDLPVTEGYELFEAAHHHDKVYFIEAIPTDMENVSSANIVKYDVDDQETEIIYSVDGDEAFSLNELCVTKDRLFWVYTEAEVESIQMMTLSKNEITNVRNLNPPQSISLTSDENFIAWYEEVNGERFLQIYDYADDNVIEVDRFNEAPRGAVHAYINDGYVAYPSHDEKGNSITVYSAIDVNISQTVPLKDRIPMEVVANNDFIVWYEGDRYDPETDTTMYVVDHSSDAGEAKEVELPFDINGLLSYHLMDNHLIFIYTNVDGSEEGAVVALNLEDETLATLLESPVEDGMFYGGIVSPDGAYQCLLKKPDRDTLVLIDDNSALMQGTNIKNE